MQVYAVGAFLPTSNKLLCHDDLHNFFEQRVLVSCNKYYRTLRNTWTITETLNLWNISHGSVCWDKKL